MGEPVAQEPVEVAAHVAARLGGDAAASRTDGGSYARGVVDVAPAHWVAALSLARDELGCDFFDWLGAVDEQPRGYAVVVHVWSTARRYGVLVRTLLPPAQPALASLVALYPGAAWHEREAHEMFGIDFPDHPDLAPLLLPAGFEGHPLRKDFVLAARVAKAWPGAVEPEQSTVDESGRARPGRRQPPRPPGVPAPGEWGPA